MGDMGQCPWGGIILILAWGIGGWRTRFQMVPDGHWRGGFSPGPLQDSPWGVVLEEQREAHKSISSLRNHSLVFLEHPVGCSVSPASLERQWDHAGEHSWRTGRRLLGANWPRTQHMSHCPELPGASTPGCTF